MTMNGEKAAIDTIGGIARLLNNGIAVLRSCTDIIERAARML
jgi:hypothetical protein